MRWYLKNKARTEIGKHLGLELVAEVETSKVAIARGMRDAVSMAKNEVEVRMLQDALSASGWNRKRAATNLNISYRMLLYKILS